VLGLRLFRRDPFHKVFETVVLALVGKYRCSNASPDRSFAISAATRLARVRAFVKRRFGAWVVGGSRQLDIASAEQAA